MKRIILLIAFCLSLSVIYAQTIDVIHLKNGFDARGMITNRTESQITLQSENGRTLTIDMNEIESMEQEQQVFDPRVLIGRWACYRANGERGKKDKIYDMVISENEGFYAVTYDWILDYDQHSNSLVYSTEKSEDIDVADGIVSYEFHNVTSVSENSGTSRQRQTSKEIHDCNITLRYTEGKLKGSIDCFYYFYAIGNEDYKSVSSALEHGYGRLFADGSGDKWNVYFVKY